MFSFQSHLKTDRGCTKLDLHPDIYYTNNPHQILNDIRDLMSNARIARIRHCELIVGKGNQWQPGQLGTLMGYLVHMIQTPLLKVHLKSYELRQENAVLFLEFAWPFESETDRQRQNEQKLAKQKLLAEEKRLEKVNKVRLLDARNYAINRNWKKFRQKIKLILRDYFPEYAVDLSEPHHQLTCFLENREAFPKTMTADLERYLWQAWLIQWDTLTRLDSKIELLENVCSHCSEFTELIPRLAMVADEEALRPVLKDLLAKLPPNIWRL